MSSLYDLRLRGLNFKCVQVHKLLILSKTVFESTLKNLTLTAVNDFLITQIKHAVLVFSQFQALILVSS